MRNIILFFSLLVGLLSCNEVERDQLESLYTRPNLIVIMTDDQGWADVGFNGCKDILTPNMDLIAGEGVRFTDAYVTSPICSPSRAGLLTGRYQDRFGYTANPTIDPANDTAGLPLQEETLARVLRKANYKSAIVGKWHLGTHPAFHPLERGFDYTYPLPINSIDIFLPVLSCAFSMYGDYLVKPIGSTKRAQ